MASFGQEQPFPQRRSVVCYWPNSGIAPRTGSTTSQVYGPTDWSTHVDPSSVGYALTYMVEAIMVILVITHAPKLLKLNLEAMARNYAIEKGLLVEKRSMISTADTLPLIRAYHVKEDSVGKTLAQRSAEVNIPVVALKVKRGNEILDAQPDLVLEEADILSIVASLSHHKWVRDHLGDEDVLDPDLLDRQSRRRIQNSPTLCAPLRRRKLHGTTKPRFGSCARHSWHVMSATSSLRQVGLPSQCLRLG